MNLKYGFFETFPVFESERILFRSFTLADAESLFGLRSNVEAMRYIDRPLMQSVDDAVKLLEVFEKEYREKNGICWAMINKESGKFMGSFAFFHIKHEDCRCEVGYMMMPEFWNRGLMTEALKRMIPEAFGGMNFHSIEANLNPGNEASKRVVEKLGFQKEGYFRENYYFDGKFIDSLIYSLLEKDFKKD